MNITHCEDCVWFASIDEFPTAVEMHEKLINTFGDCIPKRDGECGVCRKVTFNTDRPVLTNSNGYCHRAEQKYNSKDPVNG